MAVIDYGENQIITLEKNFILFSLVSTRRRHCLLTSLIPLISKISYTNTIIFQWDYPISLASHIIPHLLFINTLFFSPLCDFEDPSHLSEAEVL